MSEKLKIVVINEPVWESVKRDTFTFIMAVALMGVGVLLESSAIQWAGFLIFGIISLARASGMRRKMEKTIPEARAYLDELEAEQ